MIQQLQRMIAVITPIRYKAFGFKAEGRRQRAEGRGQRAEGKSKVSFTQLKIAMKWASRILNKLRGEVFDFRQSHQALSW